MAANINDATQHRGVGSMEGGSVAGVVARRPEATNSGENLRTPSLCCTLSLRCLSAQHSPSLTW